MTIQDTYTNNRVLTNGLKRLYYYRVDEHRFDMESATPVRLQILTDYNWAIDDPFNIIDIKKPLIYVFEDTSWKGLLTKLVKFLIKRIKKTNEELLNFSLSWTDAKLFREDKTIINVVKLDNGLYFSYNYSATHSSWVIDELLKFYGIEGGILTVHRTHFAEPQEVIDAIKKMRMEEFKDYLVNEEHKSEKAANKIVKLINGPINKLLAKVGGSYNDFYLFDDTILLSIYKARVTSNLVYLTSWDEVTMNKAKEYLEYLTRYFTKVRLEAKKRDDDLYYFIGII